jgi:hypothetical protein
MKYLFDFTFQNLYFGTGFIVKGLFVGDYSFSYFIMTVGLCFYYNCYFY